MSEELKDNLLCRRVLLLAALLVCAVLLWLLLDGGSVKVRREADAAAVSAENGIRKRKGAAVNKSSAARRSRYVAEEDNASPQRRTQLLRFGSGEEHKRIMDWCLASGIPVNGSVPELRWLKVAVTSREADLLVRQIEGEVMLCEDVEIRIPQYLDNDYPAWQGDPGPAFGKNYLEAIGVDVNDEERGRGVTVAVLDTALLEHHEFENADIRQINPYAGDDDERTNDHGTAVASLLCGKNGVSRASVIAYTVLNADGCGSAFDAAEAIVSAVDDGGAKVISMSFGAYVSTPVLEDAVEYAAAKGAVIVAAAGNNGVGELCYPAACDNVIAVGAVDADMNAAGFSNYGEELDVAAPGVGLLAATANGAYGDFTGTSAAVPCVAGILANWLAANPGKGAEEAAAVLRENCNANGQDASGAGVVDQWRMLNGGTPGIYDVAVNTLLYDEENGEITVMVQNCTAEESVVDLSLTFNGQKWQSAEMTLPSAGCTAAVVKVPEKIANGTGTLKVNAVVNMADESIPDARPGNQARSAVFSNGRNGR